MVQFKENIKTIILEFFLEECKYGVKEKMSKFITEDREVSSDNTVKEDFDEENSTEENSDKENCYRMCLVFIFLM